MIKSGTVYRGIQRKMGLCQGGKDKLIGSCRDGGWVEIQTDPFSTHGGIHGERLACFKTAGAGEQVLGHVHRK